jgi:3-hydroxybutyryl-CoA dehydrogenase
MDGELAGRPVAVLGAGTMGAGIAQVAAVAGHPVVLYDPDAGARDRAAARLSQFLSRAEEKGKLGAGGAAAAIARIDYAARVDAASGAAVVIEAAPESLDLKRALFAEAASLVGPGTVLATNTSTLSVAAIMRDVPGAERTCGLHFFNPAPLMALVEVVRGPYTSVEVLASMTELVGSWGKTPIVVADTPGFIVNRVARPYYGEALRLLGEGVADVPTIDRLARDAGFPMGPFELMDLIGIDVNYAAAESVYQGFFHDPRFRPHPIQRAMVESGRLGRKTGSGYYQYPSGPGE